MNLDEERGDLITIFQFILSLSLCFIFWGGGQFNGGEYRMNPNNYRRIVSIFFYHFQNISQSHLKCVIVFFALSFFISISYRCRRRCWFRVERFAISTIHPKCGVTIFSLLYINKKISVYRQNKLATDILHTQKNVTIQLRKCRWIFNEIGIFCGWFFSSCIFTCYPPL